MMLLGRTARAMAATAIMSLLPIMSVQAQETFNATLASVNSPDFLTVRAMQMFIDLSREKTNGGVNFNLAANGQMGSQKETYEQVMGGIIEAAHVSGSVFGASLPELQLLQLPFLYRDNGHMVRVVSGEIGQGLYDKLEEATGVKVLMLALADGPRSVWNNARPIRTPADMNGLTIRVPENPIMLDTFQALGALPTPMPFGEVYMAAKQGVIDGGESPPYALGEFRAWEVGKYFSLDKHTSGHAVLAINSEWYNRLPEEYQASLEEASAEAVVWFNAELEKANEQAMADAAAHGMEINEVDDLEAFQEAVAPVYAKYAPVVGGEAAIQAVIDTP